MKWIEVMVVEVVVEVVVVVVVMVVMVRTDYGGQRSIRRVTVSLMEYTSSTE